MNANETKPLALITGASSGIGYELARQFAENGFDLIVTAEDEGIAEAANAFKSSGAEVEYIKIDLARPSGVHELYNFILSQNRPLEAAALNAGAGVGGDFARETEFEDELNIINLNVVSTFHLSKHIIRDMVARGKGRVLFTSSVVGVMPAPLQAVYGATKAFVQSFSEAIRNELLDSGVTVTSLMPGATDTEFFDGPGLADTKVAQMKKDDPAVVAKQGFEAMMKGKDHVVGGSLMNKVQVALNKILPEAAKAIGPRKFGEKSEN
ncbi:MAG TPA: SDR family NAD(P)-dependent oxidoreductase [Bacteriovoracaceae bacterium]|nr:SDR family NAD(P)-dependent oxidoreductase [Bacteriovoracaceae bacterium]